MGRVSPNTPPPSGDDPSSDSDEGESGVTQSSLPPYEADSLRTPSKTPTPTPPTPGTQSSQSASRKAAESTASLPPPPVTPAVPSPLAPRQVGSGSVTACSTFLSQPRLSPTIIMVCLPTKAVVIAAATLLALLQVCFARPASQANSRSCYDYPNNMVRPPKFWIEAVVPVLHGNTIQGYETPIAVYSTMILDQVMWNCVAAYDDNALSCIDFQRPKYVGPSAHHDSEARALCMVHAINKVLDGGLVPDAAPLWR
eukprot:gene5035-34822_t